MVLAFQVEAPPSGSFETMTLPGCRLQHRATQRRTMNREERLATVDIRRCPRRCGSRIRRAERLTCVVDATQNGAEVYESRQRVGGVDARRRPRQALDDGLVEVKRCQPCPRSRTETST
jgi:hypothetical protein